MAHTLFEGKAHAPSPLRLLKLTLFAALCAAAAAGPASAQSLGSGSPDLVISQVYTRGGEQGATFRNDFVEIFNRGNATANLSNYTIQAYVNTFEGPGMFYLTYSSRPIAPGKYVLLRFASLGANGEPLPVTAEVNYLGLDLPSAGSRIALVKGFLSGPRFAEFGCGVGTDATLHDFFSYGAATCAEGPAVFPAPEPTTAAVRNADGCADTDDNVADFTAAAPNPRNSATAARPCNRPAPASTIQFETETASVNESIGSAEIFVTRTGDTSSAASVKYAASVGGSANVGGADEVSDFTTALGTVFFAPGETRKSFRLLITDDARNENFEQVLLSLGYPAGAAALGTQYVMRLTINVNDPEGIGPETPNPIDTASFFVRQHYADFLSREPDAPGLQFWTGEIEGCGMDAQCREVKRINVSAAFFLSIEFQQTGYFAYRAYRASFPDNASRPRGFPLYRELWHDTQKLGRDVVVNQGDWEQQLASNKQAYVAEFVTRPEFLIRYPSALTPAQFVDALNANAGDALSQAERDQLVAELTANNNSSGRAAVLTAIIEDQDFKRAELNRAFVLMEYFGYLRRNPNGPPDTDFSGYDFWLGKLNEFGGNFVRAEMVKAFISSLEYRRRFAWQ